MSEVNYKNSNEKIVRIVFTTV